MRTSSVAVASDGMSFETSGHHRERGRSGIKGRGCRNAGETLRPPAASRPGARALGRGSAQRAGPDRPSRGARGDHRPLDLANQVKDPVPRRRLERNARPGFRCRRTAAEERIALAAALLLPPRPVARGLLRAKSAQNRCISVTAPIASVSGTRRSWAGPRPLTCSGRVLQGNEFPLVHVSDSWAPSCPLSLAPVSVADVVESTGAA